jgi:hypothetical protein
VGLAGPPHDISASGNREPALLSDPFDPEQGTSGSGKRDLREAAEGRRCLSGIEGGLSGRTLSLPRVLASRLYHSGVMLPVSVGHRGSPDPKLGGNLMVFFMAMHNHHATSARSIERTDRQSLALVRTANQRPRASGPEIRAAPVLENRNVDILQIRTQYS